MTRFVKTSSFSAKKPTGAIRSETLTAAQPNSLLRAGVRRRGPGISKVDYQEAMMHIPRWLALRVLFLTLGLLALFVTPVFAAKAVFLRSELQVIAGTLHGEPVQIKFHAKARVFDDGEASGIVQLRVLDGESFRYRVTAGRAVVEPGNVVEVVLVLERVGRDGMPTGETDLAIIRPHPTEADCLIYDIVGPNVHVEAEGQLGLRQLGRK